MPIYVRRVTVFTTVMQQSPREIFARYSCKNIGPDKIWDYLDNKGYFEYEQEDTGVGTKIPIFDDDLEEFIDKSI